MSKFNAEFITGSTASEFFPKSTLPEIAFIGRSNVGKSSLLNTLVNRNSLARVSSSPGKTQQINFYSVNSQWMLVDMPGFGYAVASQTERRQWANLNNEYLFSRENLKLVCMLVDCRHNPQAIDVGLMESLENSALNYVVILTKSDKISKTLVEDRERQFRELLQFCTHAVDVLPYSSTKRIGRDQLWGIIKRASAATD